MIPNYFQAFGKKGTINMLKQLGNLCLQKLNTAFSLCVFIWEENYKKEMKEHPYTMDVGIFCYVLWEWIIC